MVVDPCAVQERVPIWVGGRTLRSVRRAATLADGWCPFAVTPAQAEEWLRQVELPPGFDVVLPPTARLDPIDEPGEDPGHPRRDRGRRRDHRLRRRPRTRRSSEYLEYIEAVAAVHGAMDAVSDAGYQDATRPIEERVEDLLGRMTLDEKVAQLTGILPFELLGPAGLDEQKFAAHLADGIGEISAGALLSPDPARLVPMLDQLQRYLVEQHAARHPGDRPPRGIGGSRAPGLRRLPDRDHPWPRRGILPSVEAAMHDVVRRQMRALGVHQACSPNLDLARDARWGRVQETYGEDPYLGSAIGVAFIRGLQGEDRREGVLATAKHFLGYAMAYGGRNIGAVQLGERELLEVYARPFGAAIAEAGLESVMCAYSDLNGEPAAASRRLLTDMLRGTLGFGGLTVADYGAVNALATRQRTATDSGGCRGPGARGRARRGAPGIALLHGRSRAGGPRRTARRSRGRRERPPCARREVPARAVREPVRRCRRLRRDRHRRGAASGAGAGPSHRHSIDGPARQSDGRAAAATRLRPASR